MYDEKQIANLMADVRKIVQDENCVVEITEDFAGYFDDLGVTIHLNAAATEEKVFELKETLKPTLARMHTPFKWTLEFLKGDQSMGILFPNGLFTGAGLRHVAIVIDPEFEDLEKLSLAMPVWAVESPMHRGVAKQIWPKLSKLQYREQSLTLFKTGGVSDPHSILEGILRTVFEHHSDARRLQVVGVGLSDENRIYLQSLGFSEFQTTSLGFSAMAANGVNF